MTSAHTADDQPDGALAIVTGVSRGIGSSTARALALVGATVVLAARTDPELTAAASQPRPLHTDL
jgi:gluconate 5-dehydrogenase